ncbi:hypothetical protein WAK64_11470 [Bacillus spongiae]|uniref:Phosphatase n=1 Tax=Bacillus spongiae TaxID=2683610 RepID=A0ABU8HE96_9BACI
MKTLTLMATCCMLMMMVMLIQAGGTGVSTLNQSFIIPESEPNTLQLFQLA